MLQSAEMRLDRNRGESGFRGTDAGDDAQQIVIWMRAPRVRIGARWLGLLGPGGESERNHRAPWAEEIEIAIAEAGVLDRAREVEAEIIGGGGHRRNFAIGVKACVGGGEDTGQQLLLLVGRDDVEPHGEDVGVLAEVFLRRSVGEERVLFVPAEFLYGVDGAPCCGAISFGSPELAESGFEIGGVP